MSDAQVFTGTKSMSRVELEAFARNALAEDRLLNLTPGIIMMWFGMLLLGFMAYLCIEWKCVAEQTERRWHKAVVASRSPYRGDARGGRWRGR